MRGRAFVVLAGLAVIAAVALVGGAAMRGSSHAAHYSKLVSGDPDSAKAKPGDSPALNWDSYLAAADAYPANTVTPAQIDKEKATFDAIAAADASWSGSDRPGGSPQWEQVGPKVNATQPGVISFSGATNNTASRTTALAVDPTCGTRHFGV